MSEDDIKNLFKAIAAANCHPDPEAYAEEAMAHLKAFTETATQEQPANVSEEHQEG